MKRLPELLQCNVRLRLDKQHTLARAVHHQLFPRTLLKPTSKRVIEHQHLRQSLPDHTRRIFVSHFRISMMKLNNWEHIPKPFLIVNVREKLHFSRRGCCRSYQLRRTSLDFEG
ncbi:hypothetical protein HanIR_Chr01g0043461 [Helianthus annuus]|nr:hypothetical protein HanIR_Chr01g0043461 [Helianthus annuus]